MFRTLKRRRSESRPESPLATADELVAADNPVDAIRLLTEANRDARDRRVERRLVELRFDAFTQIKSAGVPTWPETVEDRFPESHLPEVARADLTAEGVRSAIRNHGSLIVRGLVDRQHVDQLKADIDTTFDAFDANASGTPRPDLAGWYEPFQHRLITDNDRAKKRKSGSILAFESPPSLFDLIETFDDAGVTRLARDYFGEPPAILARKVTLRRMAHTAGGVWHQDGAFMGAGIRSLNVWLALTRCGEDAPSLDIVGRRLDQLLPTGNGASQPYGVKTEDAEQAGAGAIVRPVFDPGDALIFDHMLLHRTGRDKSMTKGRYAIETWLFAPSTYAAMTTHSDEGYSPRDQVPLIL